MVESINIFIWHIDSSMVVWYFQSRVLRVGSTSFGVLRHLDAWIGCCAPSGAKLSLMSARIHPSSLWRGALRAGCYQICFGSRGTKAATMRLVFPLKTSWWIWFMFGAAYWALILSGQEFCLLPETVWPKMIETQILVFKTQDFTAFALTSILQVQTKALYIWMIFDTFLIHFL